MKSASKLYVESISSIRVLHLFYGSENMLQRVVKKALRSRTLGGSRAQRTQADRKQRHDIGCFWRSRRFLRPLLLLRCTEGTEGYNAGMLWPSRGIWKSFRG